MDTDVIVVGAGLAGLACAGDLASGGLDVRVVEAADAVGGRVRTDHIDGYLCDRGFQVLNPSYPAVRDLVDLPALDLQRFEHGAAVRRPSGLAVLSDPFRHPGRLLDLVKSSYHDVGEWAALARWVAPALAPGGACTGAAT